MRVYLVRHGETVWNRANRMQGWSDIALNAKGRWQAAAVGRALKDVPLKAVYASTLSRAIATAQAIAAWHKLEVTADPDLRELNQGTLDGLTFEELRRDHGALLAEWLVHPGSLKMPGGESLADVQQRAWGAVERIVAAHPEGAVAVVSHNLTIVTILCRLLGLALDTFRHLRQDVAAINVLDFGAPLGPAIVRLNDTAHLTSGDRFAAALGKLADTPHFAATPLGDEEIAAILGAAAGAGIPEGAYHLVAIGCAERRRRLTEEVRAALAGRVEDAPVWAALETAPLIVAVLGRAGDVALECHFGAVIQSLRAAAHALGYGSAWLAGPLCDNPAVTEVLEMASSWRLVALLPLGVPAEIALPLPPEATAPTYTIIR